MSLNELIAQSGKFQAPDLIGQYAAAQGVQRDMQQNALNTMKMDELRRSLAEQEGLKNYLRTNPNLADPTVQTQMFAHGRSGQDAVTAFTKAQQEAAAARSNKVTADEKEFTNFTRGARTVNSVEGVAQYVRAMYSHPTIGPLAGAIKPYEQSLKENIELFSQDPFKWQVSASSVPFEKVMELSKGTRQNVDTGGAIQGQTIDYRGQVVPGSVIATSKTMAPGTAEANQTARDNVDLRRRELEFNQDPVRQAAMAAAKKNAATAITETQDAAKAVKGATEVLSTIGYTIDPKTGIANDRVSDLIRKSTSGPAEYAGAKLYSAGGGATKGDIAIGQLGTYASKLTLDIAGGKLGAGISNTDRDFLERSLGEVANPLLPSEKRLAAWQEARDRLVEISKRSVPKTPTPKASTPSGQGAPANPTPINAWSDWAKNTGRK